MSKTGAPFCSVFINVSFIKPDNYGDLIISVLMKLKWTNPLLIARGCIQTNTASVSLIKGRSVIISKILKALIGKKNEINFV